MTLHIIWIASVIMAVLAVIALGRLAIGPTVPDRLVALDALHTLVVGIMLLLSVAYDSVMIVDAAIIYAVLSFVGTIFITRCVEEGEV